MPESDIIYPTQLSGTALDTYLDKGWYRMGQGIFTTDFVYQQNEYYKVYWFRYSILKLKHTTSQQKIKKLNCNFTTVVKPLEITHELENLFLKYKSNIDFDPVASVFDWIYMGMGQQNIYDSWIAEVRHEGKLIAAGIFDKGENSIAGIMNFYDPEFKKYSLGKYLMLLKIDYAKANNFTWYYPGYIVYGYPKFDYKLFVDKAAAEIYLSLIDKWTAYDKLLMDEIENVQLGEE